MELVVETVQLFFPAALLREHTNRVVHFALAKHVSRVFIKIETATTKTVKSG